MGCCHCTFPSPDIIIEGSLRSVNEEFSDISLSSHRESVPTYTTLVTSVKYTESPVLGGSVVNCSLKGRIEEAFLVGKSSFTRSVMALGGTDDS